MRIFDTDLSDEQVDVMRHYENGGAVTVEREGVISVRQRPQEMTWNWGSHVYAIAKQKWFNLYSRHECDGFAEMTAAYHDSEAQAIRQKSREIREGRMRYIGTYEEKCLVRCTNQESQS